MQILKLVHIDGFIDGGSSKPLLITAVDEAGNVNQYVMKLFKKNYVDQNFSIAKEVLISELAKEFNLSVPNYAVIDIDHSLLIEYFDNDELEKLDSGYKFCSEFNGQYVIFNPLVSLQFIKSYDIANLFAFDNVIINSDRGGFRNKPNLLVNDDEILLIDHEQTLPFINNSYSNPNYFTYLQNYPFQRHLVITHLKSMRLKNGIFDEFLEMLKHLNIERFISIFDELDYLKINFGDRDDFFLFLEWLKSKRIPICNHLIGIIK
ncbi:HipA family kinase [Flavobacterium sp. CF136]|uniref:HipA family kinase n=1 Tax=Flavobacterium sp. (strain CF136) TaxID=1144313 RepID=UPI00027184FC|nr:HipA family kinase [Flavobacterium sp. CF136]EJL66484.1 hypothetical protein PMI10_00533 [Flavobacterium sp. CF136]